MAQVEQSLGVAQARVQADAETAPGDAQQRECHLHPLPSDAMAQEEQALFSSGFGFCIFFKFGRNNSYGFCDTLLSENVECVGYNFYFIIYAQDESVRETETEQTQVLVDGN